MSDNCFKKNDLLIAGTRMNERLYKALNPSYILPDERSIAELMVFISNYAELINYYTLKGTDQKEYALDGNWKPLIQSDEAFNYAGISITPYTLPNITFYKYVNLYETGSTLDKRNTAYRVLWDILFSVYKDINLFYTALPVYMPLRSEVAAEINNRLISDLGLTAGAYLNDSTAIPSLDLQLFTSSADDEYKFGNADNIIKGGFDKIWIDTTLPTSAKDWNEYLSQLHANLAQQFFNTAGLTSEQDRIDYSTLQLKQIFKKGFEAYARIIAKANEYLQNSLQNNSSHFAHHGLILAFLKLFGVLQTDMNDFSRKHLEYYYSRVLKMNPAPAVADSAHIVFDPAKNIDTHLIKKNTALIGGKDATGKLLLYSTDDEIVISQAKVEQIKTIFLKPGSTVGAISKVFKSPVADSADGNGAPFIGDDTSWKGFGDEQKDPVTGNTGNSANLGFYIASPVLHLTEGNRVIDFVFTTDSIGIDNINELSKEKLIKLLTLSFSGEKQWERLIITEDLNADHNCELNFDPPASGAIFTIRLTLLPQCKPVVGYDSSVCAGNLNTIYPVIKFELNQNSSEPNAYESFRNIFITKISITTTVSEITNLSLQNELGAQDASKPVQPFGPNPKIGSAFYIGHPELQFKMLTSFDITLNWLDYKSVLKDYYKYKAANADNYYITFTDNNDFHAAVELLRNKAWLQLNTGYSIFEDGAKTKITLTVSGLKKSLNKPEAFIPEILSLTPQTQNGFLRLVLNAPADAFGHSKWAQIFAQQTVAYTSAPTTNSIPNPPYTPLLESVKLQYTATQEIDLAVTSKPEQGQFFHLLPFGIRESKSSVPLLPKFEVEKKKEDGKFETKPFESSLLIGISHAVVNQNISLLLQMNEGTEDISVDPPEVIWNYLSVSGWKNFDKALLADTTGKLLKSGIVKFQVPVDTDTETTELPFGFTWVSAAIEPGPSPLLNISSNGLPKVFAICTNAVKATFADKGNDPEYLATGLAASSISKLYVSDAAVKKVNQPFASFGGRKIEEGSKFYTKVSERLRHKHRAITIWDYERLVLNEFNEVYMVKCLNHTGYLKDCNNPGAKGVFKENLPGSVMLVPVPFVFNLKTGNIYQPTFSAAKLSEIKNFIHSSDNNGSCNSYLNALHCQLTNLLVENPQYETIEVSCKIKVKQCLDANFYKAQLGDDLNKFLSPWITGDPGKINFGGKLHVSQLIYFTEQLDYIDYVTNLTIEHKFGNIQQNNVEPSIAVASTSKSVLTSFGSHKIEIA